MGSQGEGRRHEQAIREGYRSRAAYKSSTYRNGITSSAGTTTLWTWGQPPADGLRWDGR